MKIQIILVPSVLLTLASFALTRLFILPLYLFLFLSLDYCYSLSSATYFLPVSCSAHKTTLTFNSASYWTTSNAFNTFCGARLLTKVWKKPTFLSINETIKMEWNIKGTRNEGSVVFSISTNHRPAVEWQSAL